MAYNDFRAYFTSSGVPLEGLSPTITLRDISDGSVVVNAAAMTEKGSGWYVYTYAGYDLSKEYVGYCYAGTDAADEAYKPIGTGDVALAAQTLLTTAVSVSATAGTVAAKLNLAATGGNLSGSGAISWPYTITNSVSGAPIADVDVWISTDEAGNNVVASGRTDQTGTITFNLDAGTVYVWRQKSGYNFAPNPDTEVVS